jgi:hypothetical protein
MRELEARSDQSFEQYLHALGFPTEMISILGIPKVGPGAPDKKPTVQAALGAAHPSEACAGQTGSGEGEGQVGSSARALKTFPKGVRQWCKRGHDKLPLLFGTVIAEFDYFT